MSSCPPPSPLGCAARTTARSPGWRSRPSARSIAEPLYVLTDTAIVGHLGTPQLAGLGRGRHRAADALLGVHLPGLRDDGRGQPADRRGRRARGRAPGGPVAVAGAGWSGWRWWRSGWSAPMRWSALMGAEGAVRTNALVYLRISLLGVPALLLVLAGTGYLRGLQDTRTPLAVAVGTGALNLVLEVIFIYGLGRGLGASAFTTVVAQYVAAAIYLRQIGRAARAHGVDLGPHPASLRRLGAVGRDLLDPHRRPACRPARGDGGGHPARRGRRGRPPDRVRDLELPRPRARRHRHRRPGHRRPQRSAPATRPPPAAPGGG